MTFTDTTFVYPSRDDLPEDEETMRPLPSLVEQTRDKVAEQLPSFIVSEVKKKRKFELFEIHEKDNKGRPVREVGHMTFHTDLQDVGPSTDKRHRQESKDKGYKGALHFVYKDVHTPNHDVYYRLSFCDNTVCFKRTFTGMVVDYSDPTSHDSAAFRFLQVIESAVSSVLLEQKYMSIATRAKKWY